MKIIERQTASSGVRNESVLDHESAFNPFNPNSKKKDDNFKDLMVEIYKYRLQMQVLFVKNISFSKIRITVNWVKVMGARIHPIRQVQCHAS